MPNDIATETTNDSENPKTSPVVEVEDVVPRAKFRELLNEKKQTQAKLSELQTQLDRIQSEKEERERQALVEQNKFEELYKSTLSEKERLAQEIAKRDDLLKTKEELFIQALKLDAVLKEVGSLKRKEYQKFIQLDQIEIDEETGEINIDSVKKLANKFKSDHPELLEQKISTMPSHAPHIGATQPQGFSGTAEQIKKMYAEKIQKERGL